MSHRLANIAIIGVAVLSSCSSPDNDRDSIENAMPMISAAINNQQTAQLAIQAFNSHNVNDILKNWDSTAIDYGDGSSRPISGLDSIRAMYSLILTAIPDIQVDSLRSLTDNGEHVIVTGEWSGTFKNDSLGVKETRIKFWNGDFFTFNEKGKIIQHRSIQSHVSILAQLGLPTQLKKLKISN
jgi:predicted ester cyclase